MRWALFLFLFPSNLLDHPTLDRLRTNPIPSLHGSELGVRSPGLEQAASMAAWAEEHGSEPRSA